MKKRILQGIILVVFGLFLGFICIEIGLRTAEALKVDWVFFANEGISEYRISDEKLGIRLAPNAPGHDAKGFRNKMVPKQSDIIAIGDSQTWGINVNMSQAWPQTLGRLSEHSTYNMGLGFYNTIQYLALTEEALQLSPKVVIIGLYFGNDIWGTYSTVYSNDYYTRFRNNELELSRDTVISRVAEIGAKRQEYRPWIESSIFAKLGSELTKRSRTLRMIWVSWLHINNTQYKADKAWALDNPDDSVIFEIDGVGYVMVPITRLQALDLDNPRIAEGLRISKEVLLLIQKATTEADVKLLVALIPTQESVYAEAIEKSYGRLPPNYAKLVEMETRVRDEIIALCNKNGIQYADILPALTKASMQNDSIYPATIDGHPRAHGYLVIASFLNDSLDKLGWLK